MFPPLRILVLSSALCLLPNASRAQASDRSLLVFAAASLADALTEVGRAFEERESVDIIFNFASSSILARQIGSGAPADVFMSADEARMEILEQGEWLVPGTRHSLLGNQLVIVAPVDSKLELAEARDLAATSFTRIAVANPYSVPAGIYARLYLGELRLWDLIEPRVIPAANVRTALAAVESGNVEAGFVYLTDAMRSARVAIRYRVPIDQGPVISYPVAVVRQDALNPMAFRFVSFLSESEAMQIFVSYGFFLLTPEAPGCRKPVLEAP